MTEYDLLIVMLVAMFSYCFGYWYAKKGRVKEEVMVSR